MFFANLPSNVIIGFELFVNASGVLYMKTLKLSTKIILSIITLSAICVVILLIVINIFVRGMILSQAQEGFYQNNVLMSRDVDDWVNRFKYLLTSKYLMAVYLPAETLEYMAVGLHETYDEIAISFFSFSETGTAISSVEGELPPDWELFSRPWYIAATENPGEIAVQSPFWSVVEQTWATSTSRTVTYADGREGVVSFTIKLEDVFNMMGDFEILDGGYVFLVDRLGVIISHPKVVLDPARPLVSLADLHIYDEAKPEILAGNAYFVPFITESETPAYILSRELDSAGWIMVSVIYASNINATVNSLTTVIMVTASVSLILLSLMVLAYVSYLIRKSIGKSVLEFRQSSSALAQGLGLKISESRDDSFGLDEISGEFDRNLIIMNNVMEDLSKFSYELGHNSNISYRIDSEKYSEAFKRVIGSINGFADKFVEALDQLVKERELAEISCANSQAKSKFLATMSHEIRTPMNAILGITEIQLQKPELDSDIKEALEKTYVSGEMLLAIINDILDLSKIESGKMELVIDKCETASIIGDVVMLNLLRIEDKDITFTIDVSDTMPAYMYGDEIRLKQILNNVLSNAIKYTHRGRVKISVDASPFPSNAEITLLKIVVADTGQGMTPNQVELLFNPYSRFNMEENLYTEGTGLGMSITANLVELMGGSICVESKPGVGTKITISIPLKIAGDDLVGKETSESLGKFQSSNTHLRRAQLSREPMPYGRILLVDDLEMNIYVARGLLSAYSLQVDSACSGFEAIDKVAAGSEYDIIFMDHMMPQMDGLETTKRLRQMGYSKPIVALTANAIVGQSNLFLENGFDDFISKPIDTRVLNQLLNRLVRDVHVPNAEHNASQENKSDFDGSYEDFLKTSGMSDDLNKEFARTQKDFARDFKLAITHGDIKQARFLAHTIKGLAYIIGENTLGDLAGEAEKLLIANKLPSEILAESLIEKVIGVITAIEARFKD